MQNVISEKPADGFCAVDSGKKLLNSFILGKCISFTGIHFLFDHRKSQQSAFDAPHLLR